MDTVEECRPAVQALVARIFRRRKDDPDVEDCTHETLRRALEHNTGPLADLPVLPWLLGIARHVALDALRADYRRRKRTTSCDEDSAAQLIEQQRDLQPNPEVQAAQRQRAAQVAQLLEALPPRQRDALWLFHVEELGYREIADRLGVSVGTVGTWVLRARQGLAAALPPEGTRGDALREPGAP